MFVEFLLNDVMKMHGLTMNMVMEKEVSITALRQDYIVVKYKGIPAG